MSGDIAIYIYIYIYPQFIWIYIYIWILKYGEPWWTVARILASMAPNHWDHPTPRDAPSPLNALPRWKKNAAFVGIMGKTIGLHIHMGVSIVMEVPKNGWKGKSYLKMDDDWGYPHFRKPPYWFKEESNLSSSFVTRQRATIVLWQSANKPLGR